ncbi:MAG: hypothetical protein R3F02_14700 [Thiolinea sp.]
MKLDHVLLRTADLAVMSRFLVDVIGLEPGPRPPFPFAGAWFYSEGQPLVHVVDEPQASVSANGAVVHVALSGAGYGELISRLQAQQLTYYEKDVPLSGERQVFISGPDQLMVDMLFPIGTAADRPMPYARV